MAADTEGTVVLLHGLFGFAAQCLPLAHTLSGAGFHPRLLGYHSWGQSLFDIRDQLAPQLDDIARASPGPIHLVGHSMGGLVARSLIARYRPDNLGRVVMLGTPNGGSEVADFIARHAALRPILGQASPVLTTTRADAIAALLGPVDYALGIIAGNHPFMPGPLARTIPGDHDGKVSIASTRLPEAADHIVLPLSHTGLLLHASARKQVRHFLIHGRFARSSG